MLDPVEGEVPAEVLEPADGVEAPALVDCPLVIDPVLPDVTGPLVD